ncbi:transposase [Desulfopila sp. IMCC35008]|uniref:transposase n=1 Tax=Desulfopila sp. IMCC35008 TaxID=2653858 RepID=UPI00351992E8
MLCADQTSTSKMHCNLVRLYISSVAYILIHALRRLCQTGIEMTKAQCDTNRLKIQKLVQEPGSRQEKYGSALRQVIRIRSFEMRFQVVGLFANYRIKHCNLGKHDDRACIIPPSHPIL